MIWQASVYMPAANVLASVAWQASVYVPTWALEASQQTSARYALVRRQRHAVPAPSPTPIY